ncbi:MAG: SRPBCC family protein [Longimicrobiales bacterium]
MATRRHVHEEVLPATPSEVFALLHTPSAIRQWWSAARAVVHAAPGGVWAAAWGVDEDRPDFLTTATMRVFAPPTRIVFDNYQYHSKDGPLPFEADFVTEFLVAPHEEGATLRVVQDGFPEGPEADDFYAGCEIGWADTFKGIRHFLEDRS